MCKQVQTYRVNSWGRSQKTNSKQQESCDRGTNRDKKHRQKSEEHQGSHCPLFTLWVSLTVETNTELTLHDQKWKRGLVQRQISTFKVTHLLRVVFQFQTISSFFAFSLKRIVKNKCITLCRELQDGSVNPRSGPQHLEHGLKADPNSIISLGENGGLEQACLAKEN